MGGGRRGVSRLALSLVLAATTTGVLTAQPPAISSPARATGSVSGRLVDAVTGAPIAGGILVLRDLTTRDQRVVTTTDAGQYRLLDLPAADYTLHASALDYVGREYGQRHTLDDGQAITLRDGERRERVDIALMPGGAISGRVTTQDGRPLAYAEVEALRPQLQNSLRLLLPVGRAESDIEGRFRISGLPPGHYYVAAIDPADEGSVDPGGEQGWDQTFYPGAQTAAAAERVRLTSGGTLSGVDFPLLGVTRVTVQGRLLSADEDELAAGSVVISPESEEGLGLGRAQAGMVLPDGTFEFRNVSPGDYRLRASARTVQQGPALFASFLLSVRDRDISNAVLYLNPGASLFGRVELAEGTTGLPPLMTEMWVTAPLSNGSMGSGITRSRVFEDGSFSLATPDGVRVVRLEGIPDPWSLDAVFYQGRNLIDVPFDLKSGDERVRLRLVLTDRASRLVGTVRDEDGRPINDRTVVVLPVNATYWHPGDRHVGLTYPDTEGRYEIRGLPAGAYLVAAVAGIHGGDLYEQAVFQEVAAAGTETLIEAGQTTTLDLVLATGDPRLAN